MDDIDVRDLDPRPTVSVRVVVPAAELDLAALFDRHLPTIAARLAEGGIAWDGAPFGRYHEWTAQRVDVEMGIPVGEPPVALPDLADVPPGELGRSMLPGGRAAVLVHRGSYRGLPASWDRLHAWTRDRGLEPRPGPWESYVDAPDDAAMDHVRTELVQPVL